MAIQHMHHGCPYQSSWETATPASIIKRILQNPFQRKRTSSGTTTCTIHLLHLLHHVSPDKGTSTTRAQALVAFQHLYLHPRSTRLFPLFIAALPTRLMPGLMPFLMPNLATCLGRSSPDGPTAIRQPAVVGELVQAGRPTFNAGHVGCGTCR